MVDAGAQHYLTKPIDVKTLLTVLNEHLSEHGQSCALNELEKI
jgi:DNA-binding response OmpR family regulator